MPVAWINDPAELRARFASKPARIGLDTEFIRERTYWPKLALVQIALRDADGAAQVLLVDPLAPGMTVLVQRHDGYVRLAEKATGRFGVSAEPSGDAWEPEDDGRRW